MNLGIVTVGTVFPLEVLPSSSLANSARNLAKEKGKEERVERCLGGIVTAGLYTFAHSNSFLTKRQLGGTFVFDCESGKLLFAHHQDHFGDHPQPEEVMQAVRDHFTMSDQSAPN